MKKAKLLLLLIAIATLSSSCTGQKTFGANFLNVQQTISLPGIKGRIDHMDCDLREKIIYVAALENNSLEIVDLKNSKSIHSIKSLNEPQGVAYIPQTNEILVANGGNGKCIFFNGKTFQTIATIELGSDADDVRYDSTDKKIYVGYGEGGIAVIDAIKHQKLANIKLPAHPEGFQLNKKLNELFVNVPDAHKIILIDLKTEKISKEWKTEFNANFPMAIDEADNIIFIGYRHPAKLVALNTPTGNVIASTDLVADVDDLFFNAKTKKIYASGGGGAVNIFSFENFTLKQIADIPTRDGARTSLLIPSLNSFILAERASGGKAAQLQVYSLQ